MLYLSHLRTEFLEAYRQPEIFDFFLGRHVLVRASQSEFDVAVASAKGRAAWPAPGSVYLSGSTVVVLLQPEGPGVSRSWVAGQTTAPLREGRPADR